MSLTPEMIEKVKPDFSLEAYLSGQAKTWEALHKMSSVIKIGMTEEEATKRCSEVLKEMGSLKFWHRTYVRFGTNTLKGYGEQSDPGIQLGENDTYFLDIGPVWGDYEGDAGATFVTGDDSEMIRCKADSEKLFNLVKDHWKTAKPNGQDLYRFAAEAAEKMGWVLNLKIDGHRLSDFPHAVYSKAGLGEMTFRPSAYAWVLEIQIRHPTRPFGAFYEDILA